MRLVAVALGATTLVSAGAAADPPWSKLRRPLHLPRLAPGRVCPVSRIDRRVDWERSNIFGGSGIGRGTSFSRVVVFRVVPAG
jgi:hypothetical protein